MSTWWPSQIYCCTYRNIIIRYPLYMCCKHYAYIFVASSTAYVSVVRHFSGICWSACVKLTVKTLGQWQSVTLERMLTSASSVGWISDGDCIFEAHLLIYMSFTYQDSGRPIYDICDSVTCATECVLPLHFSICFAERRKIKGEYCIQMILFAIVFFAYCSHSVFFSRD